MRFNMSRALAGSLFVLLAPAAWAGDVSPKQIASWLCDGLEGDPARLLTFFPAAEGAQPVSSVTEKPGRSVFGGSTRTSTWTLTAGGYVATYHYQQSVNRLRNGRPLPDTPPFGFSLRVKSIVPSRSVTFASDEIARPWVASLGRKCKDPGHAEEPHVWEACDLFDSATNSDNWSVTVDVESQVIEIAWQNQGALRKDRFCSLR